MDIGICSYSFHRLLASGKQDIFGFIRDCQALGCTQLDPWNAHLAVIKQADASASPTLSAEENDYLDRVEAAADESGLPWGTLAIATDPMRVQASPIGSVDGGAKNTVAVTPAASTAPRFQTRT